MAAEQKPDFERYVTSLHCEEPDRVPLGDWHVDKLPKERFYGKKIETLKDEVAFWYKAGFDFVTYSTGILEPVRAPEGMTTKGDAVHTEYGEKVSREWAQEHKGIITNWEQFETFPWPSVDEFDLSPWDYFDKNLPSGMKGILLLGKIYSYIWMAMGAETFFDALESNEELVAAMVEKVGQIQYETFLRVIEHPSVGAVLHPDDIAHNTGLLVHPRHLRKYVFPWYKKIGDVCRDKGIGNIFHSDGDCTEVLDDLIACGFHAFNPVQPKCMDIVEVKRKWSEKLCLIGNLNLDSTLTLGSPEDVRAEVYERIRTIGPGGGYMVASSNSVTDFVPLENMKAMIDATFEFGRYPIQLEEKGVKGTFWTFQAKPKLEKVALEEELKVEDYLGALLSKNVPLLIALVQKAMESGVAPPDVVSRGMIPAMRIVGEKFQSGEIYIPEMMFSAKAMSETLAHFKDRIVVKGQDRVGTIVLGTVKGDLHDIGKNLVGMMLAGQGFTVKDLGVSVAPETFVQAIKDNSPAFVGMSALLTTTMIEMKNTIAAIQEAGLRDAVQVVVGGAPVTQKFADDIGADGFAFDAPGAAQKCRDLLSE